ncbi:uncharacterized protein [Hoplias malabaricus]|uniref:uncharacterized protein isoform X2 n=1 Tax=Hoplias malabaricus TaxID=27720 RepID=UPI00346229C6
MAKTMCSQVTEETTATGDVHLKAWTDEHNMKTKQQSTSIAANNVAEDDSCPSLHSETQMHDATHPNSTSSASTGIAANNMAEDDSCPSLHSETKMHDATHPNSSTSAVLKVSWKKKTLWQQTDVQIAERTICSSHLVLYHQTVRSVYGLNVTLFKTEAGRTGNSTFIIQLQSTKGNFRINSVEIMKYLQSEDSKTYTKVKPNKRKPSSAAAQETDFIYVNVVSASKNTTLPGTMQ